MKKLTILGATGSIGASTFKVLAKNTDAYQVYALVAGTNVSKMAELCIQWRPRYAVMANESSAQALKQALASQSQSPTEVLFGVQAMEMVASNSEVDIVMAAIVGAAGLLPTLAAVKAGKRILLANKEALVMSGQLFMDQVRSNGAQLLPVDSEHNAIFQCLPSDIQTSLGHCQLEEVGVQHILLTGSGGPFRYRDIETFPQITVEEAVAHPNWSMGPKISVDSATMMNKGLEYIEAKWLFNCRQDQLKVLIHPQSVIHSMVQYRDGSVIAQMGQPDMATPIANSLSYPNRIDADVPALDFTQLSELTFNAVEPERYPCLSLAIDACFQGQHATTSLNAANEIAVHAFLNKTLPFVAIAEVDRRVLNKVCGLYRQSDCNSLESILELDRIARRYAEDAVREITK